MLSALLDFSRINPVETAETNQKLETRFQILSRCPFVPAGKGGKKMDYLNAFWVGGLICALVQILMEKTKMMPGRIMVLLVVLGAIISVFGWYEPFQEFAGAGASVPLLGFGNVLMKGVKEAVDEQGLLGLFAGGFKAGAVGTCAALVFGYLASLIFQPKMKK